MDLQWHFFPTYSTGYLEWPELKPALFFSSSEIPFSHNLFITYSEALSTPIQRRSSAGKLDAPRLKKVCLCKFAASHRLYIKWAALGYEIMHHLNQWCRRRGAGGATAPPLLKVGGHCPPTLGHDCTLKFNEEKISSCSMSATVAT